MATTGYAIRHRTTRRFLAASPACGPLSYSDSDQHAYPYDFMSQAEMARLSLESFASCHEVVPIALPEMRTEGVTP